MAAFNRLNGVPCVERSVAPLDGAHREWGHRGVIVSDWYGVDDRVAALQAGLHLQMPHGPSAPAVVAAVRTAGWQRATSTRWSATSWRLP